MIAAFPCYSARPFLILVRFQLLSLILIALGAGLGLLWHLPAVARPLWSALLAKHVFLLGKPKEERWKNLPDPRYLLDWERKLLFQQVS